MRFCKAIAKKLRSTEMTTSKFAQGKLRTIVLRFLNLGPDWGQRNLISRRIFWPQNTAYGTRLFLQSFELCIEYTANSKKVVLQKP